MNQSSKQDYLSESASTAHSCFYPPTCCHYPIKHVSRSTLSIFKCRGSLTILLQAPQLLKVVNMHDLITHKIYRKKVTQLPASCRRPFELFMHYSSSDDDFELMKNRRIRVRLRLAHIPPLFGGTLVVGLIFGTSGVCTRCMRRYASVW